MPEFDPKSIPILDDIIENDASGQKAVPVDGEKLPEDVNGELTDEAGGDFAADAGTPDIDENTLPLTADEPLDDALLFEEATEAGAAEDAMDSFTAAPDGIESEEIESEGIETEGIEPGETDDKHTDETAEIENYDTVTGFEADAEGLPASALIDYPAADVDDPAIDLSHHAEEPEDNPEDASTEARDTPLPAAPLPETTLDHTADTPPGAEFTSAGSTLPDEPPVNTGAGDVPAQEPAPTGTAAALQAAVDDIVQQLLPGLEQQLRLLVRQALEERLPEGVIQHPENNPPELFASEAAPPEPDRDEEKDH